MMPRHTAEQSTVKVNKAADLRPATEAPAAGGRRGFGFGRSTAQPAQPAQPAETALTAEQEMVDGASCPIDPQERLQCDSCQ